MSPHGNESSAFHVLLCRVLQRIDEDKVQNAAALKRLIALAAKSDTCQSHVAVPLVRFEEIPEALRAFIKEENLSKNDMAESTFRARRSELDVILRTVCRIADVRLEENWATTRFFGLDLRPFQPLRLIVTAVEAKGWLLKRSIRPIFPRRATVTNGSASQQICSRTDDESGQRFLNSLVNRAVSISETRTSPRAPRTLPIVYLLGERGIGKSALLLSAFFAAETSHSPTRYVVLDYTLARHWSDDEVKQLTQQEITSALKESNKSKTLCVIVDGLDLAARNGLRDREGKKANIARAAASQLGLIFDHLLQAGRSAIILVALDTSPLGHDDSANQVMLWENEAFSSSPSANPVCVTLEPLASEDAVKQLKRWDPSFAATAVQRVKYLRLPLFLDLVRGIDENDFHPQKQTRYETIMSALNRRQRDYRAPFEPYSFEAAATLSAMLNALTMSKGLDELFQNELRWELLELLADHVKSGSDGKEILDNLRYCAAKFHGRVRDADRSVPVDIRCKDSFLASNLVSMLAVTDDTFLVDQTFESCNLTRVYLAKRTIRGCRFQDVILEKAIFDESCLDAGNIFIGVWGKGAKFTNCTLRQSNYFVNVSLREAIFERAKIVEDNHFLGVDLTNAQFRNVTVEATNEFRLVNFTGIRKRNLRVNANVRCVKCVDAESIFSP